MADHNPLRSLINRRSMLGLLGLQAVVIFVLVGTLLVGQPGLKAIQVSPTALPANTTTPSPSPSASATPEPATPTATAGAPALIQSPASDWIALSMNDHGYAHLFAFHPQSLPLTRLTANPWDDITPAVSPDGTTLAFASRQNGFWDLFLLDLHTGAQTRLTDTVDYDASPSWSPDSQWLAYETYSGGSLEIAIRSVVDPAEAPLLLTNNPAADHSPAWAPDGRHVAFVSDRSGEDEIWLADLDQTGERSLNLSQDPQHAQRHPAWSPDGLRLAWGSSDTGYNFIDVWDSTNPTARPARVGEGIWPAWDPAGTCLTVLDLSSNQTYLSGYTTGALLAIPPVTLPGAAYGLTWSKAALPAPLPTPFDQSAQFTPAPLWAELSGNDAENPAAHHQITALEGVEAPHPYLVDLAAGSFNALRERLEFETGWDVLAALDNAYIPLTDALPPGFERDWAYTGRSFSLSTVSLSAGWVSVAQEYVAGQLYWRVYAKTYYQDGSQGVPLAGRMWDLTARTQGDPQVYDQGGKPADAAPGGYWVDVTDLAQRYGWERLPAMSNWRTYFQGTRYNEFLKTDQLDWQTAMLDLYPPEALITPTAVVPPTATPTRAPARYKSPVPSLTPEPSQTPTPRPTWTPLSPTGQ